MQLYLLTVLTNVLAGLTLASGFLSRKIARFSDYSDFMMNPIYRVILGGLSLFIAIFNLINTHPGDTAFIGDLFPSLTGIAVGVILIAEFWNVHSGKSSGKGKTMVERIQSFSKPYLTIIGLVAVGIGILHAVIPSMTLF